MDFMIIGVVTTKDLLLAAIALRFGWALGTKLVWLWNTLVYKLVKRFKHNYWFTLEE